MNLILLTISLMTFCVLIQLKKQTTVQATGVASGLLETIQGSGFKLQTLNLSFEDEEVAVAQTKCAGVITIV